jgi:16S rRNA U1498 N3-methylase RsmE
MYIYDNIALLSSSNGKYSRQVVEEEKTHFLYSIILPPPPIPPLPPKIVLFMSKNMVDQDRQYNVAHTLLHGR